MLISLAVDAAQSLILASALMSVFTPYSHTYRKMKRYAAKYHKHIRDSVMKLQMYYLLRCLVACAGAPHQLAIVPTFNNQWSILHGHG